MEARVADPAFLGRDGLYEAINWYDERWRRAAVARRVCSNRSEERRATRSTIGARAGDDGRGLLPRLEPHRRTRRRLVVPARFAAGPTAVYGYGGRRCFPEGRGSPYTPSFRGPARRPACCSARHPSLAATRDTASGRCVLSVHLDRQTLAKRLYVAARLRGSQPTPATHSRWVPRPRLILHIPRLAIGGASRLIMSRVGDFEPPRAATGAAKSHNRHTF